MVNGLILYALARCRLAVAREITEQYEGKIVAGESMLGGARMEVIFGRQHSTPKDE